MGGWQITRKDLRLLVRDRRALAVLILLPLIFITIIGLTTGQLLGWRSSNQILRIAYIVEEQVPEPERKELTPPGEDAPSEEDAEEAAADEESEPAPENPGQELIDANMITKVVNALHKRRGIQMIHKDSIEVARKSYQEGDATAALVIGKHFVANVKALAPGDVMSLNDGALANGLESFDMHIETEDPNSGTNSILDRLVFYTTVGTVSPYPICGSNYTRVRIRSTCAAIQEEANQPAIALDESEEDEALRDAGSVYDELIPSYTVLFVFFLVNIMARSFIHERDMGTLRRLRIAPLSLPGLLTGKTTPFYVISILQTATLFIVGKLLYGMSWGEYPLMLIPVIFATSLAATGLGLLVGTWVQTESQVSAYANIVVITMAGISGCFMPREWLPDAMQTISLATPHAWALDAYSNLLTDPTPDPTFVLQCSAVLVGFAVLYFVIGLYRFRAMR